MEIELVEYKNLVESGKRGIHSKEYYVKLAHSWKLITKAIKVLSTLEDDVFNNFKYLEQ